MSARFYWFPLIFLISCLHLIDGSHHGLFIGRRTSVSDGDTGVGEGEDVNQNLDIDLSDNVKVNDFMITDEDGAVMHRKYKTQQIYLDIPIFGACLVMEEIDSTTKKPIFGKWYDPKHIGEHITNLNPQITTPDALNIAFNKLDVESMDQIYGDTDIDLFIYYHDNIPYLSWIIKFGYIDPNHPSKVFSPMIVLNANTGDIFAVHNKERTLIEACGDAGNGKTGQYTYCDDKPPLFVNEDTPLVLSNDIFEVYDNNYNPSSNTNNADAITCTQRSGDSTKCDINDGPNNGAWCPACDVFNFANNTFAMYDEWLPGAVPYPVYSQHIPFRIYIHVGSDSGSSNYANAFYSPSRGIMGFGDGTSSWYPLTTADITAHEIAHGFTDQGSNLIYDDQSGGMNEAYSDIIGECLKYYYFGENDWATGSHARKAQGAALRFMYNPPLDGRSIDHFDEYSNSLDVHYSSGLYNKAAYLLNADHGWSMQLIFEVFSRANLYYWLIDSTFNEGLCGLYTALADVVGFNSGMESDLQSAFANVGLECPTADPDFGTPCGSSAGLRVFCFYRDIVPSNSQQTQFAVDIKAVDDGVQTDFEVNFMVNDHDCVAPTISLSYEEIDYNFDDEYIHVYDGENNLISECTGAQRNCGIFVDDCVNNLDLGIDRILKDESYTITLEEGSEVHPLCDDDLTMNAILTITCQEPTETEAPTTDSPTTDSPTTDSPTTGNPTTDTPTTDTPTTASPTTPAPTTDSPTTASPITAAPTTDSPTTDEPTTASPTTAAPTTDSPTTDSPTTDNPTTDAPTTDSPTTPVPTTDSPTTDSPTTGDPTTSPITASPNTASPTTDTPTTDSPTTGSPTTSSPTTNTPTTAQPTTDAPTTDSPTTNEPTTATPTTLSPTTNAPTTASPTTLIAPSNNCCLSITGAINNGRCWRWTNAEDCAAEITSGTALCSWTDDQSQCLPDPLQCDVTGVSCNNPNRFNIRDPNCCSGVCTRRDRCR